jgi:hypothetical protein
MADLRLLGEFVQSKEDVPFLWGYNDCFCFAADWVALLTGVDYMEPFRGLTSAKEALRLMRSMGGVEKVVSARLKLRKGAAEPGDVVMVVGLKGFKTLGVCLGERLYLLAVDGPVYLPSCEAKLVWSTV